MDRAVLAAIVEYVQTSEKVIATLLERKGDIAGHEFHGNRWTGGLGSAGALASRVAVQRHIDFMHEQDHASHALDLLKRTGGFTYDPAEHRFTNVGDHGFAVSPYKGREAVFTSPITRADLEEYIRKNADVLGLPGHAIGGWDDENGRQVLDVSVIAPTKDEALTIAHANDQDAIFDFAAGQSIAAKAADGEIKGDTAGHEFHGNRFTGGIGGHADIMRGTPYKTEAARERGLAQQKETIDKALVKYGITAEHVSANLDKVWKSAKDTVAMREGRVWYEKSRGASIDALKGLKGSDGKPLSEAQRVAMVAACSPRCAWEKNLSATGTSTRAGQTVYPNLEAARAAAQIVSENPKITIDEAQAERLKNPKWELGPIKPGTYEAKDLSSALLSHVIVGGGNGILALPDSVGKAIDIARGAAIDDELTGDKVRSFYTNLINPGHTDAVTVDTWMARIALGDKMSDTDLQQFLAKPAGYDYVAEQIREQARAAGVVPQQYQAVTWVQARDEANGEVEYLKDKLRRSTH